MRPRFQAAYAASLAIGLGASPIHADEAHGSLGAQVAQSGHSPECICRAQGRTFTVGESACLRTASGPRMAQCGMVLNNTSWQFTERPCPES